MSVVKQKKTLVVGIWLGLQNSGIIKFDGDLFEVFGGIESKVHFSPTTTEVNVGSTINNLNFIHFADVEKFLGRNFSDPFVQSVPHNFEIIEGVGDSIRIKVEHNNEIVDKSLEDIVAEILKHLKFIALKTYPDVDKMAAVITVPVCFNKAQRRATIEAAQKADVSVLQLIDEPVACALDYFHDTDKTDGNLLYFEYGFDYLDVAVISNKDDQVKLICHERDNSMGFESVEKVLLKYFQKSFKALSSEQIVLLSKYIKDLPWELSVGLGLDANILIPDFYGEGSEKTIKITREKFDEVIQDIVEQWILLMEGFLEKNKISKSTIKHVQISTNQWEILKLVKRMKEFFGDASYYCFDLAYGAAILAFHLKNLM